MKTLNLCVNGLCEGNSPATDEFPAQKASNAEKVSIWWRHNVCAESSYWYNYYTTLYNVLFAGNATRLGYLQTQHGPRKVEYVYVYAIFFNQ